jgi:ribosomal protein S18 acetylase RimI-like enzyme
MVIRQATNSDVAAIAHLHAESWRAAYRGLLSDDFLERRAHGDRLATWQKKFSLRAGKPMFVLLAQEGARLAGFACVFPDEDAEFGSFLDNLHVAPGITGQGVGKHLMSEAVRRLVAEGSRSGLYLWVMEQNHRGRRFYGRRVG